MKGTFGQFLRDAWLPVCGSIALGTLLVGCGDKTDPKAVGLDELKFANGMKILDQGDGNVRLMWNGMNNEDDFAGYNIYGGKDNGGNLTKFEGKTIPLLNDKGETDETGKATLQLMNYNGTNWETAGAANNAAGDLQVVPYYKAKEGDDPVLPSCKPATADGSKGAACAPLATEGATGPFNGTAYFDVTGLKVGGTYCFTTLAAMDGGKKVAQTTSEVRCIVPKAKVKKTGIDGTPVAGKLKTLDFDALRTKCGETGAAACEADKFDVAEEDAGTTNGNCGTSTPDTATVKKTLCVEVFTSGKKINFTSGPGVGIQDMGYYKDGFDAANLPKAPKLDTSASNILQNKDGYSLAGQSLPIENNHVYVVAAPTAAGAKTFYYHWVYVTNLKNDETNNSYTFDSEIRVSNQIDAP